MFFGQVFLLVLMFSVLMFSDGSNLLGSGKCCCRKAGTMGCPVGIPFPLGPVRLVHHKATIKREEGIPLKSLMYGLNKNNLEVLLPQIVFLDSCISNGPYTIVELERYLHLFLNAPLTYTNGLGNILKRPWIQADNFLESRKQKDRLSD